MLLCKFKGKNGSMGFTHGEKYWLKTTIQNDCIVIRNSKLNVYCPYSSLESFYKNWEIICLDKKKR